MRDIYDQVFANLYQILKPNGKIIIVENGGQDEFCKLLGIEEFTEQMKNEYKKWILKKSNTWYNNQICKWRSVLWGISQLQENGS